MRLPVTITLLATSSGRGFAGTVGNASARLRADGTRTLALRPTRQLDEALAPTPHLTLDVVENGATHRFIETIIITRRRRDRPTPGHGQRDSLALRYEPSAQR